MLFHTPIGLDLPFTYPPLAAIMFCPFAWLHMPAASVAITVLTLVLLIVSTVIVLSGLDVWNTSTLLPGPAWLRRLWLAVVIVAPAAIWMEPIASNFAFGQINVVLMTLVIADCVPRRTPWPRGLLLGLGIALKLTPAVFLLYFLLRRDSRAALTALASFAAATLRRVRAGLQRLVGVLDPHRAPHRSDRRTVAEHRPEHRGRSGPDRRLASRCDSCCGWRGAWRCWR